MVFCFQSAVAILLPKLFRFSLNQKQNFGLYVWLIPPHKPLTMVFEGLKCYWSKMRYTWQWIEPFLMNFNWNVELNITNVLFQLLNAFFYTLSRNQLFWLKQKTIINCPFAFTFIFLRIFLNIFKIFKMDIWITMLFLLSLLYIYIL